MKILEEINQVIKRTALHKPNCISAILFCFFHKEVITNILFLTSEIVDKNSAEQSGGHFKNAYEFLKLRALTLELKSTHLSMHG